MENEESEENRLSGGNVESPAPTEATVQGSKGCYCPLTIEPIVFAIFFADALSDSVTTNFVLMRTCENHFHYNQSICNDFGAIKNNKTNVEAIIQPYSALILTSMNFIAVFLPSIISLFAGPWSDYNGRKLLLIIPSFGCFLKYVLLMVFTYFPNFGPEYGLVSVVPVALCGGIVNFISAAYSYVSDITTEQKRFFRISIIEAVLGLGICSGLLLLSNTFKPDLAFRYTIVYTVSAGVILLALLYTYFFVPESLKVTVEGKGIFNVFDLKLFKEMVAVCFQKREGHKRLVMFLLVACLTFTMSVGAGNANVLYLFTRLRFGWNIQEYTFWASVTLPIFFLGIFIGTFTMSKICNIREAFLGFFAFGTHAAVSFYIGFIPPDKANLMYYAGVVNILGGNVGPVCRAILSKTAPKEDLGKVFALTSSSESLFPLIAGPLYTALYNSTLNSAPNAFLMVSGSLFLFCCLFFVIIYFIQKSNERKAYDAVRNSTTTPSTCSF